MTVARIEDVSNAFEFVGQEYQEVKLAAGVTPEQFGVTGSGADATTQLRQWMAEGGQKTALAGESYRAATWLGQMSVAPSSRSTLAGSTIIQGYSLPNNMQMGVVGAGADVSGLSWQMDGSNYFRRGFRLDQGASLRASKLTSPTPSPAPAVGGYGTRGHVLGIFGDDARIEDVLIDGFQQQGILASPDVAPVQRAVVRDVEFRGYVAGFKGNNMPGALVDGLYARGIGPDAITDPGHNLLTGGSSHSVYKDAHQLGDGSGAGEHFLYSDGGDGVQGVRILGVTNWASGQCFIKLRGHDSFVVSDCHGGGIGLGNAAGTNEDVLRLEYCRNGVVSNLSMRPTVGRGGFDGIHINSCWNTRISNVSLAACERASVFICSAALAGYTSPPNGAVDGIRIEGIIADQKNGNPFLMFGLDDSATTNTVTVGNITITGIQWAGTRAQLYAVASGATLVRLPGTRIHLSGQASDGPFTFDWDAADAGGRFLLPSVWPTPEQFGTTIEDATSTTPSAAGQRFLDRIASLLTNRTFGPLTIIARGVSSPASNGLILRSNKPEAGTAIVFWKHPTSEDANQRIGQYTGHGNATGSGVDELACYTTNPSGAMVNRYKVLANIDSTPFILTGCTGISRSSGLPIVLGEEPPLEGGGRSKTKIVGGLEVGDVAAVGGEKALIGQNDAETGAGAGLHIRNEGTGDAVLQFWAGGRRIVTGIDNSEAQRYKIAGTTNLGTDDLLEINPADGATKVYGDLVTKPTSAARSLSIGDMGFRALSDTELQIRYRGSDGIVRTGTIALSA